MTIFDKLFTKHSVRHSLPSGLRQTEFSVEMRNPPTHINFICQVFILTVSVFLHLPEAYQLSSLVLPFMRWLPFYRKKRETVRRKFVQPLPPDPFTFQIFPSYPLPPVVAEEIPSSNPRFIPLLYCGSQLLQSWGKADLTCFPLYIQPLLNWLFLLRNKSAQIFPMLKKPNPSTLLSFPDHTLTLSFSYHT